MGGLVILAAWLGVAFAGAVATIWWAARTWKRRNELHGWMKGLTIIVAATALIGALGTLLGLVKAFGATGGESTDPSEKARMLAEGISIAMNCTAAGLLLWLPSAITLTMLSRRQRAR